jgi:glycosyltransferase involved in cell wall biosynthesis
MTTLGFHARMANPLSMGYLAYLACFDSWRKIADKVVVVDGGSTDGSVQLLQQHASNDPKIRVLCNDLSHWGSRARWEQSTLNMQLGHEALAECDWIIRADADHVLDVASANSLRDDLESRFTNEPVVAFNVNYFKNGRYHRRQKPRNWIINNRLARMKGCRIGWGKDKITRMLSDHPMLVERESEFADPETGVRKTYLTGELIETGPVCDIEVYRYGHFFFTVEQAISKCRKWDDLVTAFAQKKPKNNLELLIEADAVGISGWHTRDELMRIWHPPEVQRLIGEYYEIGMLGGAKYRETARYHLLALQMIARLQRALPCFS